MGIERASRRGRLEAMRVVGAAIVEAGLCLVAQRGPAMAEPGKWEFPGGKVEAGENPRAALAREVAEELGIAVAIGRRLGRGSLPGPARPLVLDVYLASWQGGTLELREHQAWRWVGPEEVAELDWAEADRPVLPALVAHLRAAAGGDGSRAS
jgi:8-oxo-dGTP diphosphatase